MNSFADHDSFCLPDELAVNYEIKSCLKYSEQAATYLLGSKESKRLYLLKAAADPVFAGLLANEKNILEYIHQTTASPLSSRFPTPVYLGTSHAPLGLVDAGKQPSTEITLYIRTYIEGKTLEELCETNYKKPGLQPRQALDYIIELTELLHFLHTLNPPLIHRDIKPQNVVIDSEGGCHFIDFGISRFYQNDKRSDTFIMGTKLTAPPEQFGYQQTDIRSDLYSLGILLFYCITGEYETDDHSLGEIDPSFSQIIRKATMFDPDKRYQTTDELLPDLLAARYPDIWRTQSSVNRSKFTFMRMLTGFLVIANLCLFAALLYGNFRTFSTGQGTDIQNGTPDSYTALPISDKTREYTFTESLIEEAVRRQLNIEEGPVTYQDLEKVTELHIIGLQIYSDDSEIKFSGSSPWVYDDDDRESGLYDQKGTISSLEDILYMPNLDTLCLYRQQISDISLLKDTKITHLGLGYNPLTDLTPLAENPSIVSLNLASLDISDAAVLSELPNLTNLNISDTKISSLKGLENCRIQQLNLHELSLTDYSELRSLPYLRELTLNMLTGEVLGCIKGLPLTKLEFSHSAALKLDDLSVLPELETLSFRGNHFETLLCEHPVLPRLTTLDLLDVTIEDFRGLSSLDSLITLHTYGAVCESYDGLDQFSNLQIISCTKEQYEQIHEQYPNTNFVYYYP